MRVVIFTISLLLTAALPAGESAAVVTPGLWFRSDPGASGWREAGWREPWNQHGHMQVRKADEAGQVLAIQVDAKAEAKLSAVPGAKKDGLPLGAQWVYRITCETRAVGQIEAVSLILRRRSNPYTHAGSDSFPVSKTWTVLTTQIRPAVDDDDSELILTLKGVGSYELRWLTVTRQAAYELPSAGAGPARGELLANHDFALEGRGWSYGVPEWGGNPQRLQALPAEQRPGFLPVPDTARQRFMAGSGIFGFLTYAQPLRLRLGREYLLRVEGDGAPGDAYFWIARPGQNIDIIRKLPLVFRDGVAAGVYRHEVPTHGTLSERAMSVYVRVEHFGKAPLQLRSISLVEVDAQQDVVPSAPPCSAVTIEGLDPQLRAVAPRGTTLRAQLHASGLAGPQEASLELADAAGGASRRLPVQLQPDAEGNAQAVLALPDLPSGWYEATLRLASPQALTLPDRFAVVPVRPVGLQPRGFLGAHMTSNDAEHIPFLAGLGIGHARCFEFAWPTVEKEQGVDTFPAAVLARYHEAKVAGMIILNGSPLWASSAPEAVRNDAKRQAWDQDHWSHYPPDSDEAWAGYVRSVVRRGRAAGVDAYEVWNEPNGYFMRFNPQRDASQAAAYVRLLRVAYAAVKAEDPQAVVVAGATAGQAMDFFRQAFALGLNDHCDAISYHAYGEIGREMFGAATFTPTVADYRALMTERGAVKPIWDSESGTSIPDGPEGLDASLTLLQGLVAREAAGLARWYIYSAEQRHFPGQSNFHMVIGFDGRPLVSVPLLAVYASLLAEATFSAAVDAGERVRLYRFTRPDGETVLIGWQQRAEAVVRVNVPGLTGTVLDAFGRRIAEVEDGAVELTTRPRWIVAPAGLRRLVAP